MTVFELITTRSVGKEVAKIREAFAKKRELEKIIVKLIKEYECETGLAIDMIKYQRDITLPIKGARYTDLSIIISPEE
jgi:hypothetical protein